MSDERESFEKWALDQDAGHAYWLPTTIEFTDGGYEEPTLDLAWEAWQAGREAGLREAARFFAEGLDSPWNPEQIADGILALISSEKDTQT